MYYNEEKNRPLKEIFERIGKKYGITEIVARYDDFRKIRINWFEYDSKIEFTISDYMMDAPQEVLENIAESTMNKIFGDGTIEYNDITMDYLRSKEFLNRNQELYVERNWGADSSPKGKHIDLQESYDRLLKKGLIEDNPDIVLRWWRRKGARPGTGSIWMHAIEVNKILDDDSVSENTIDYTVYALLMCMKLGYDPKEDFNTSQAKFIEMLNQYPGRKEAEECLKKHHIYMNPEKAMKSC